MANFTVSYRTENAIEQNQNLAVCAKRAIAGELHPYRTPAAYRGQVSLPGYFWMSRLNRHLMYESKLEMATLLHLDFNSAVEAVTPQPFRLQFEVATKEYSHIPDFFVRYKGDRGEVINVKPLKYVGTARNARTFNACRDASGRMGFAYTTRSEPEPIFMANLWWLGGYRRLPPQFKQFADYLIDCAAQELTIKEIKRRTVLPAMALPVLFFMIWRQNLRVNLHEHLNDTTKVCLPFRG